MEAQANTTREQSNKNNIGWRPSHGENGGVGNQKEKKKKKKILSKNLDRQFHFKRLFIINPHFKRHILD